MCQIEFTMLSEPYYNKEQNDSEESIDQYDSEPVQTRREPVSYTHLNNKICFILVMIKNNKPNNCIYLG